MGLRWNWFWFGIRENLLVILLEIFRGLGEDLRIKAGILDFGYFIVFEEVLIGLGILY